MSRQPSAGACWLILITALCLFPTQHPPRSAFPTHSVGKARYATGPARLYGDAWLQGLLAARASAALIAEPGRALSRGSAVHFGRDTFLTAAHVLRRRSGGIQADPRRYEVRMGDREWPIRSVRFGPPEQDVCVVVVGRDAQGHLPDPGTIQSIRAVAVHLDDRVYVVGGDGTLVADGARVLFPFDADTDELAEILRRAHPDDRDDIRASYRSRGGGRSQNYSRRFSGQPAIGIDSDTRQGMSGGGVYLKSTGRLIGILVRGQPDAPTPWRASWLAHEIVLPLAGIRLPR